LSNCINQKGFFPGGQDFKNLMITAQNRANKIEYMLYAPSLHAQMSHKLYLIADLEIRLMELESLYNSALNKHNFPDAISEAQNAEFSPVQIQAISLLQDLYLDTLNSHWQEQARIQSQYAGMDLLPPEIPEQIQTSIFETILNPAVDLPIMNAEFDFDRALDCIEKIHDMQNALFNI